MGRRRDKRKQRKQRIKRYRERVRQEVESYATANPNATEDEIKTAVAATLKKDFGSSWIALFLPLIMQLIQAWLKKRQDT